MYTWRKGIPDKAKANVIYNHVYYNRGAAERQGFYRKSDQETGSVAHEEISIKKILWGNEPV